MVSATSDDGEVHVLAVGTGKEVDRFKPAAPSRDLAWSGDGRLLAVSASDHQLYLRDLVERRPQAVLEGHRNAGIELHFSHDGGFLISRGWDGRRPPSEPPGRFVRVCGFRGSPGIGR